MTTMKRVYQVTATVLLGSSAWVAYESLRLKYYTKLGPGPGFFPFWLSVLLAILAGIMLYQAIFREADPKPEDFYDSRLGYLRMLAICAAWAWATVLMVPLGYRLTMIVFFPFLLTTLGRVKWYFVMALTLSGSIIAFWVFNHVLRATLPIGPMDGIFEPLDDFFDGLFLKSEL